MKNRAVSSTLSLLLALSLAGTLFLSGCATTSKVSDGNTFSSKAVLLDVPFKRQTDSTLCGLAVVEMLSLYYHQPLSSKELKKLKKEAALKKGTTGKTLAKTLKDSGYYTAIFAGTLDKKTTSLTHHLDLRRPLIVMLSPEGGKSNHYQLVSGYDPKLSLFSVLDPERGPLAVPMASFKASWERADFFTLLAVPEGQQ